jgi:tetratricopeptide (TPR) repeat protein
MQRDERAYMRRIGWSVSFIILIAATQVSAADDVVTKAMKLYEKRHYAEAATTLRADLQTMEQGKQGAAQLTLGMVYLKSAELHRDLYQESLAVHLDHLKKISSTQGKSRSRFVDLYLGETLLESGNADLASSHLEKFSADESVEPRYKNLAKVSLGLCLALQGNREKADEVWTALDASDPGVKAALAAAYSKAGLKEKKPVELADASLAELKKIGGTPSLRHITDVVTVYAAAGLSDKSLELLRRADLKSYSYRESLSKTKIIEFYDTSLLGDLSSLYLQAAIFALEKAVEDEKLRVTANFYLGEAYALAGKIELSLKATASFIASPSMPQQYRDKAAARQAANQYQKGRQFDAIGAWSELSKKQPADPDVLAEILFSCARLRAGCPKVAQTAAASVETGEGKRFSNLNIALGKYYLAKKDYARATSYLEAGRDKGNKNKIESNDPAMLVSLAQAYYRTKKFSEALEIYFEMSKQFPEVRQLQDALQGVYAVEHKSAGDVKIN